MPQHPGMVDTLVVPHLPAPAAEEGPAVVEAPAVVIAGASVVIGACED